MQWAPSLLLLLICVAAVEPLQCFYKRRRSLTVDGLHNGNWSAVQPRPEQTLNCNGSSKACARLLINYALDSWEDYYSGCYDNNRAAGDHTGQLVHKHCVDPQRANCTSTQFFTWYGRTHKPAYLCCCHTDLCDTRDILAFAKQQLAITSTAEPPSSPTQKVACERSMRKAATRDGLHDAVPTNEPDEECEAAWAPCVELVYNGTDGLWRRWRAGCSYKMGGVNYADIVKQFCSASYQCRQFDMIEPETRRTGSWDVYRYTEAYACCCIGTGCLIPDTVAFSNGIAQTPPPPTALATTGQSEHASTRALAASTRAVTAAAGGGGDSLLWLWLLVVVVALLLIVIAVVAATVIARQRQAVADDEQKQRSAIQAEEASRMLPFSAYVPRSVSTDDAPTMGDESSLPGTNGRSGN